AVVGTIKIAIWLPLRDSNSRSRRSSSATCSGESVCVRSVTGARAGGISTCARDAALSSSNAKPPAIRRRVGITANPRSTRRFERRRFGGWRLAEIHGRRLRDRGFVLDREILLHLVSEQLRREIRRER